MPCERTFNGLDNKETYNMTGGDIFMMIAVIAPAIVLIGVIKVISDNNTRRRAIDAGTTGESIQELFRRHRLLEGREALKYGFILASIGAALLVVDLTGTELASARALGLIFLFPGAALVAFHLVMNRGREE
jgi:hypothetical protein